jgi:hypothetical protein
LEKVPYNRHGIGLLNRCEKNYLIKSTIKMIGEAISFVLSFLVSGVGVVKALRILDLLRECKVLSKVCIKVADKAIASKEALAKTLEAAANWIKEADGYERALSLSTRFLNKMDPLWENAGKIKPIEGFQDIVCHGDKYSVIWKDALGNEVNVSAQEFANILKNSPVYGGGPIRLISCETGAPDAITAKYISKYLGVDVLAPTDIVFVDFDGVMTIGKNNIGKWVKFSPGD